MKRDLERCAHTVTKQGATPIFCTVTPMNIAHYNQSLITDGHTDTLKHQDEYAHMQEQHPAPTAGTDSTFESVQPGCLLLPPKQGTFNSIIGM